MSDANNIKKRYAKGTKLYKYDDNSELQVIRIMNYDTRYDDYKVKTLKGNTDTIGETKTVEATFLDDWIKLNEDGVVSFNILKGERKDVMVAIHPMKLESIENSTDEDMAVPFAVCRQDIIDLFKMTVDPPKDNTVWAGISVNRNNCPAEMSIKDFMDCHDVLYTRFVNVYLDDTLDDILECVELTRFDDVLKDLKKYREGGNIVGCCSSVRELLTTHSFMYDFHEAFNIVETPFIIKDETSHLLKEAIGQMRQCVVNNVYIIPYDKTHDLSEFKRPYVLMTPDWDRCKKEDQKIWIVGYDIDESQSYLENKYGTDNREDIIKQLGFNVM